MLFVSLPIAVMYRNSLTQKTPACAGHKKTSKMKKVIATVAAFMLVVGVSTTVNAQGEKKKEGEKKEQKGEKKGEKKDAKGEKKEAKPKN